MRLAVRVPVLSSRALDIGKRFDRGSIADAGALAGDTDRAQCVRQGDGYEQPLGTNPA